MFLSNRVRTVAVVVALTASGLVATQAGASEDGSAPTPVLDHKSQLERSLAIELARANYAKARGAAKRLDLETGTDLGETQAGAARLRAETRELRKAIAAERKRRAAKPEFASPESVGVDQATLEAIAACESGGDPTAVSADGTYRGKYQFHPSTWASVGGSGDPAAASEAEQDYRAALLLSQSGAGHWPVCG